MLHAYLVKVGSQYQEADSLNAIIKSPTLIAWPYNYLNKVQKYGEDGYLIVQLDKSQLVLHGTVRMLWSDGVKIGLYQDHPQE